jgi:hypothetical protein
MQRLTRDEFMTVFIRERLSAVHVIADDRIAQMRQMHADLVRATCFQFEFNQRKRARSARRAFRMLGNIRRNLESLPHPHDRHGVLAEFVMAHHVLLSIALLARWVRTDRILDHLHIRRVPPVDHREISLVHLSMLELMPQLPMRLILLREHDASRSMTIKPMHHPGSCELIADLR